MGQRLDLHSVHLLVNWQTGCYHVWRPVIGDSEGGSMPNHVSVRRQGKQWAVYVDGELFEGGFFSRDAALRSADAIRRELAAVVGSRNDG